MTKDNTKLVFAALLGLSSLALTCFIMAIVFSYVPSLVYPKHIVNVANGNLTEYYLRCDKANGEFLSTLLEKCNTSDFKIEPDCNIPSWYSYWYKVFVFGKMECPSGYLESFTRTENLSVNLVAVASSMMILGGIIFLFPMVAIYVVVK